MAICASYGQPQARTGATAAGLFAGGTTGGPPVSGTFALGAMVADQTGALWICTAAGSPGTWAQVGANDIPNEFQAAQLVNATSVGDAGNRSDQFLGSSLGVQWTNDALAPTGVGDSVVFAQNLNGVLTWEPYTPSGAFDVQARVCIEAAVNAMVAIAVTDSGGFGGNGYICPIILQTGDWTLAGASIDSGSQTIRNFSTIQFWTGTATWIYIRLVRDGSNNCFTYWSWDRQDWSNPRSFNKAFTAARLYFVIGNGTAATAGIDFVDVVG